MCNVAAAARLGFIARTRVPMDAGELPTIVLGHVVGLLSTSGTIGFRCIPTIGLGHGVDLMSSLRA